MANNIFGGALEILQEEAKITGKAAMQQITGMSDDQKKQAGQAAQQQGSNEKTQKAPTQQQNPSSEEGGNEQATKEFVKELYESDEPAITPDQAQQKEMEDKQKMEALRQKLHSEYYQQLTNRPKTQEEAERPAEKVDRQEMEDLQKKQEEDQKKQPIAVNRAERTTEMFRGASG
ncbi:MAG: hypothetical protein HY429_04535 [Candidatus Levybacteria bacterium]|nr:hypothetical protein [Candidatus Levybacteria bacterium]